MGTINEGIKKAIRGVACFGAAGGGWIAELLAGRGVPIDGIVEQLDRFNALSCGAPLDSLPPLAGEAPFEGGQCPGVTYSCWADITVNRAKSNCSGPGVELAYRNRNFGSIAGKITRMGYRIEPTTGCKARIYLEAENEAGQVLSNLLDTNTWVDTQVNDLRFWTSGAGTSEDCGNPPPEVPPIEEHEEDIDIEYDDPDGNPVTLPDIPVKFFRPCLNLDGIRIPFEVQLPFAKICGKIGLRPDLTNILEPSIDIDECPSQKESAGHSAEEISNFFELSTPFGVSEPEYSGSPVSPTPRPDKPALGAYVASMWSGTDPQDATQTAIRDPTDTSPDLMIPDIGMIRFLNQVPLEDDQFEYAWSEPIKLKQVEQLVVNDWEFGAVDFQIQYRAGWTGQVSLLYRKTCCDACAANDPNKGLDDLDRCRID